MTTRIIRLTALLIALLTPLAPARAGWRGGIGVLGDSYSDEYQFYPQGLRIFNFACSKYFGQVIVIPATTQSLGLEAIVGLLLLQQADRQPPQ
jgi:hypothetical protein